MRIPLLWLDVLVVATLVSAIGFAIATNPLEPSIRRGRWKMIAEMLFCSTFLLASFDSILTRQIAPRCHAMGKIVAAHVHGGKDASTSFIIQTDNASQFGIRASTESANLKIGTRLWVEWMAFDGGALRYKILDGPAAGETFQDVLPFASLFGLIVSIALGLGSYSKWKRDPYGHPTPDNRRGADGVDRKSLLNLSR